MKEQQTELELNYPKTEPAWRKDEATEKQLDAIRNMRHALGSSNIDMPETKGDASDEISKLKDAIHNNIHLGGSINPSNYYVC